MPENVTPAKSLLDAYFTLPQETYQFIASNVVMHDCFEDALKVAGQPGLDKEQIYDLWKPIFDRMYEKLFRFFFQPFQTALFPFGDFQHPRYLAHPSVVDACFQMMQSWGDLQVTWWNSSSNFFSSWINGFAVTGQQNQEPSTNASPFGLMAKAMSAQAGPFSAIFNRMSEFLGENEFPFSKSFREQTYKFISLYPQMYRIAYRYECLFADTWDNSLKTFAERVRERPESIANQQLFHAIYTEVFTREFEHLFTSDEFMEVQNSLVRLASEMTLAVRKGITAQFEMFPALPFVLRDEVDSLEKTVHEQKRKLDILERRLADFEEPSGEVQEIAHA